MADRQGKPRGPAKTQDAADFRAACERHGITRDNCREMLAIGASNFYAIGNGDQPVSRKIKLILEKMDEAAELRRQLHNMRDQ